MEVKSNVEQLCAYLFEFHRAVLENIVTDFQAYSPEEIKNLGCEWSRHNDGHSKFLVIISDLLIEMARHIGYFKSIFLWKNNDLIDNTSLKNFNCTAYLNNLFHLKQRISQPIAQKIEMAVKSIIDGSSPSHDFSHENKTIEKAYTCLESQNVFIKGNPNFFMRIYFITHVLISSILLLEPNKILINKIKKRNQKNKHILLKNIYAEQKKLINVINVLVVNFRIFYTFYRIKTFNHYLKLLNDKILLLIEQLHCMRSHQRDIEATCPDRSLKNIPIYTKKINATKILIRSPIQKALKKCSGNEEVLSQLNKINAFIGRVFNRNTFLKTVQCNQLIQLFCEQLMLSSHYRLSDDILLLTSNLIINSLCLRQTLASYEWYSLETLSHNEGRLFFSFLFLKLIDLSRNLDKKVSDLKNKADITTKALDNIELIKNEINHCNQKADNVLEILKYFKAIKQYPIYTYSFLQKMDFEVCFNEFVFRHRDFKFATSVLASAIAEYRKPLNVMLDLLAVKKKKSGTAKQKKASHQPTLFKIPSGPQKSQQGRGVVRIECT